MPTVRKTTPGTVTIHDAGTFTKGTTRQVPQATADYLVEERGGFERVHDGGTGAFPSEEDAKDVEFEETIEDDASDDIDTLIEEGVCPWCGDDYDGVAQHASSAHPDEYEAYRAGESE